MSTDERSILEAPTYAYVALAGALPALWWFEQTLNGFSQIGMLIGLVTKNGILSIALAVGVGSESRMPMGGARI